MNLDEDDTLAAVVRVPKEEAEAAADTEPPAGPELSDDASESE